MKLKYLAAVAAALGSTTASAATLADLASKVEASGWISGSYTYSPNDQGAIVGRANDLDVNSFTLNQAVVNLSTAPGDGFGGTVQVLAGNDAANIVNFSYGDGDDKLSLPLAYISYTSGDLTVIGGRFATLAGYEVVADPLNPTLSRPLLFANAEPYYHTGVRAALKLDEGTTAYLGVNNSAFGGYSIDQDEQKTIEAGLSTAFGKALTFGIYDYYGVESNATGGKTNYLDAVAVFTASDALTLGLNFDYFSVKDVVDIIGVAGYATFAFTPQWSATLRLETVKADPDPAGVGFTGLAATDSSNTVNEATITLAYKPADNFRALFEARIDSSDDDIYVRDAEAKDTQPTVGVKGIYTFGL